MSLVDQSDTKKFKSSPTIASGDFKASTDGGTLSNLGTLPTVTPSSSVLVKVTLSAGEMNGDNTTVVSIDASGAEWCDRVDNFQTAARQIDDLAYPATSGRSMVVDANGLVDANAVKVGPTGSGTAQTARDLGASVLVGGYVAGQDIAVRRNTAQAGASGSITLDASASATDDLYKWMAVVVLSGTGIGQARLITGYTGSTKVATVAPNWTTNPASDSLFAVLPLTRQNIGYLLETIFATPATAGVMDINVKNWRNTAVPAEDTAGYPKVTIKDGTGVGEIDTNAGAIVTVTNLTNAPPDSSGVTTLLSRIPSTLFSGITSLAQWLGLLAGKQAGNSTARTELRATGGGSGTYDETTDSLEAARDNIGTASNLGGGATLAANLSDIEAQTDDIGAAGAGLTAIPWNAAWDAEVQSEVDDALVARNIDKLVLASGTADSGSTTSMVDAARTEGDADYWKGRLLLFTSGNIAGQCAIITDFNQSTDTFTFAPAVTQAVSTQNYVILPGLSVWDDTLAEHLASGSAGNALNAAGSAGDPWATALPGAYGAGTAGKILADAGTNISTLLTRIPSALFSGITSLAQWLGLIAGKQTGDSTARTELRATGAGSGTFNETTDSLEAVRDNLPTDPADASDIAAAFAAVPAAVLAAAASTPIASNVKEVNDVALQGTGTAGDPWEPV